MSSTTTTTTISTLLPTTPYALAYALPLLMLSVPLTFGGAFLTLDRTRSFAPRTTEYKAIPGIFELKPKRHRFRWFLEGGVGGLLIGFTFGAHLATFLSLLIPATTASASLSPPAFLAVWIVSALTTTLLSGRYRIAALVLAALQGGTHIALALSIILHPSRLPRLILLGVFTALLVSLALASSFIPPLSAKLLHPVLRTCTAASGAFGLVFTIAILLNPREVGWADGWERFWVKDGEAWGTGKEKGLSAAWGILWVVGVVADWGLRRWLGECPDEKWDNYLTKHLADLPGDANRAGTFQPPSSLWDKFFSNNSKDYDLYHTAKSKEKDMIFPSDKELARSPFSPTHINPFTDPNYVRPSSITKTKEGFELVVDDSVPAVPAFLKKSRSQKAKRSKTITTTGKRKPIKFGADDSSDSDTDSDGSTKKLNAKLDDKGVKVKTVKGPQRPWVVMNQPSFAGSDRTLVPSPHHPKASEHTSIIMPTTDSPVEEVDLGKVDYDAELQKLHAKRGDKFRTDVEAGYSDREDDNPNLNRDDIPPPFSDLSPSPTRLVPLPSQPSATSPRSLSHPTAGSQSHWVPAFMQRHQPSGTGSHLAPPLAMPVPVPATPSLIRAVDRIQRAQRDVYGSQAIEDGLPRHRDDLRLEEGLKGGATADDDDDEDGGRQGRERAPRWEEFWREVKVKAQT